MTSLAGPTAPSELLDRFGRRTLHAARSVRRGESPQTTAPIATDSQPHLEPPEAPYEPTLPVAAATLRRGAIRERTETEPSDEMDLTTRIKRILDDEARRHGIDV